MEIPFIFFATLLFITTTHKTFSSFTTHKTFSSFTTTTDQDALLAFKNTLITLDPNNDLLDKNWSTNGTATSVCYWIGVSCGIKHQRVTALNISGFGLQGTLSPHLGNLTFLKYLDISSNNFSGLIPAELRHLYRLREMNASYNSFVGEIPSWFGDLPHLETLRLRNNTFSGKIPPSLFNNNSCKLKIINMAFNSLSGSIPVEIENCKELEILSLAYNHFNGRIPRGIGSLSMLTELFLGFNDFKGSIPNQIGSCTFLEILFLDNNHLTGPIPVQLWKCTSLKWLALENNYLTGSLPSKISVFNLEMLHLNDNQLSGEIPSSINNASKLTELQLSNNSFSGVIPNFGNLRLLQRLHISDNNLSGGSEMEFISSLTNCRFLENLEVTGNPLNNVLPVASLGNLSTSLKKFLVSNCNISGVIPSSIGNLTGLQRLDLFTNQLTGFIPPTIGKLNKQLQSLDLGKNQLRGYIPSHLCRLTRIFELYLDHNLLTGSIPECFGEIVSLRNFDLGSNNLTSTIPFDFWNLKDLLFLNLSSNYFSGQLSSQIASLKALNRLDLSHNQFTGDIPRSIDGCQSLQFLSLSDNEFQGPIPRSLGNMKGLSTIDLSNNNLSGSIPTSLESLDFLQSFNVSYNKLQGKIPTGGHFVNFTAQSFFNNSDLCGSTKFHVPACAHEENRTSKPNKVGRLMKYIGPPFVLVIFLATVITLVLITRQRRKLKMAQAPADHNISPGETWRRVSYIELVRGTNTFSETNLLGRGSFGSVFKATLSDGLNVAVKVFNLQSERAVYSFDTECEILSNIRHRNLVRIIGCCSNTEFKALVLGYMPNGSLEKWLHSEDCYLNLIQRLQIAIEVALALEYLHHGHTYHIVHCDIKPSNVLLDEDMVAHLADFGISKLFEDGETMVHTKTLPTIGYAAPEYGSEGKVSTNGDVYSYGILLLEMFTTKKPTDDMFSGEMSLKEWVYRALQENAVMEVAALDLLARENGQNLSANEEESISSIFNLAMKCLAASPDERINMIETVRALERIKAKVMRMITRPQRYV